jgi:hypothetical protein
MATTPQDTPVEQQAVDRISQLEAQLQALMDERRSKVALRLKEPDLFSGRTDENVRRWIFQVEQYFLATKETDSATKVAFVGTLLRGNAAAWWEYVVKENELHGSKETDCPWTAFKEELVKQFRPINHEERARDKLAVVRQRTSVSEYVSRFMAIIFDLPDITESEKIDRFFRGLKPRVKQYLLIKGKPKSFYELMQDAERMDATIYYAQRLQDVGSQSRHNEVAPMELGSVQRVNDQDSKPRFQKLSVEERQRLIREGKCLYCRQPGHVAVHCPLKRSPNGKRQ